MSKLNAKTPRYEPYEGVAYVLMVQRSNFPNRDASDVRREFQKTATTALAMP